MKDHQFELHEVVDPRSARRALDFLDAASVVAGLDLQADMVDESELERLERLVATGALEEGWHARLAARQGTTLGYVAVTAGGVGDVAAHDDVSVLATLLHEASRLADARPAVWVRRVTAEVNDAVCAAGLVPVRQLAVLSRRIVDASGPAVVLSDGRIRQFDPDMDTTAVIAVLDAAYRDTADGPWTSDRFASRTSTTWFRPEDVLVALDAVGQVVGVHWLKRRSRTVGEVYNLAVHPDAHGQGIGRLLLDAGLERLAKDGCTDAVLWVDQSNEVAAALYHKAGFTQLWNDVQYAT